jgi:putative endopeptidase
VLRQNTAIPALTTIFSEAPVEVLRNWTAFHLVSSASPYLSKRFADANFDFYGKTLSGQPQQRDRWKRAVAFTDTHIGESVGRVYCLAAIHARRPRPRWTRWWQPAHRAGARLQKLDWMGPRPRQGAWRSSPSSRSDRLSDQVARVRRAAGRPRPTSTANYERGAAFSWTTTSTAEKPVDETEWGMTPRR